MKSFILLLFSITLLTVTFVARTYHASVMIPPIKSKNMIPDPTGKFLTKANHGVNHVVLVGDDFSRGYNFSLLTKELMDRQEKALYAELDSIFPSITKHLLFFGISLWYYGFDKMISLEHKREMYGVSLNAPARLNHLADPYTRQLALHGLHEVGQSMVDSELATFACTVVATPKRNGWLIGRNFDFEGGRVFDEEKIVKWVHPNEGIPYVSVIWAGMVGAVTGVNQSGIYASLNAAGTDDSVRVGTPTTLVLEEILRNSRTAEDAIGILKSSTTMISDIFVIFDSNTNRLFRIEKSPRKSVVIEETGRTAVTNHMVSDVWDNDKTNKRRIKHQTTMSRQIRATKLLDNLGGDPEAGDILKILRDKSPAGLDKGILGHRGSIDALIATHAVVYDSEKQILYVSEGPSLTGRFIGYDLKNSFSTRHPHLADTLPKDTSLKTSYFLIQEQRKRIEQIQSNLASGICDVKDESYLVANENIMHPVFLRAKGDYYSSCKKDMNNAVKHWRLALEHKPAYQRERKYLKERLGK